MIEFSKLSVSVTPYRLQPCPAEDAVYTYVSVFIGYGCPLTSNFFFTLLFFLSLKIYYSFMLVLVLVPCTMIVISVSSSYTGNTNVQV